ncbi:MAG: hypothetical protein JNG86_06040, partial [Verrucomicrobiaceae bacterium]|nr:hypothetical protein [Verrucomicrobiaceae bacterium]
MHAFLTTDTGHSAALTGAEVVIVGSEAGVQLPVRADLGIGPRHFELQPVGGTYQLRALSPDWPVTVNGAPVHVAVLWDGDVIRAGALSLTFRLPARLPTVAPEPVFTPPAPVIPAQPYLGSTMALTRPVPHLDWSQAAPHAPVEQATITTAPPPSKIQP